MKGALSLILTGHVPYLRIADRRTDGEEALHETIAYAILPTLNALIDLRELGMNVRVALGYSPILLEQLSDIVIQKHFVVWMQQWLAQLELTRSDWERQGETHYSYLARFYLDWGHGILDSFINRHGRNLVTSIRELCDDGVIEPLAGAATHAYLPLLGSAEMLRAQLTVGLLSTTRHLGGHPRGIWLPECGYSAEVGHQLAANEYRYTIVDRASITDSGISSLRPYWAIPRQLVVLLRDTDSASQIWSLHRGYLGDPLYRTLRRDMHSGLALWRASGGYSASDLYDPYDAFRRAQEHAAHFCTYIAARLEAFHAQRDRPGMAVVVLDAELLGRRWFEGPTWLRSVLEQFANDPSIQLITPSSYMRNHRPRQEIAVADGSWGDGGDHRSWMGRAAQPLHQALHEAEERLIHLVHQFPNQQGMRERALNQALRELMLAQSSDWPLLLGQGDVDEEMLQRPSQHLHRCSQLCTFAEQEQLSPDDCALIETLEELDNPFPHLNYRVLASGS